MPDHQTSVSVSIDTVARYWKMVELGTLSLLVLLRSSNPIFKIAMALHIGLQTTLVLSYSVIVYYKASINSGLNDSQNFGLFQRITGFIPSVIKKMSALIIKMLVYIFRIDKSHSPQSKIDNYSYVLAYLLIMFRKIMALTAAIYITAEDNESIHTKAMVIYSLLIPIQMKFINSMLNSTKSNTDSYGSLTFLNGVKSLLSFNCSKSVNLQLLQLTRNRLFLITNTFVVVFLYYTFDNALEPVDTDLIWNGIFKIIVLIDALFSNSFIVELSGLKLHFMNPNDTIV